MPDNKFFYKLINVISKLSKYRTTVMSMAAVVVFITTYLLILPAFTLEKTEAEKQGGIDLHATETESDGDTDEVNRNDAAQSTASEIGMDVQADTEPAGDPLSFEGDNYKVYVLDEEGVLPDGTAVNVEEIDKTESSHYYKKYYKEALSAIQNEKGPENVKEIVFARFYDITLTSDDREIEPAEGDKVNVRIEYDKAARKELSIEDSENVKIVHFTADGANGEIKAEVLDAEESKVQVETDSKDHLQSAEFEAAAFSVYAIVYTVDFSYEVDGNAYSFSMKGADSVSLRDLIATLHVYESDNTNKGTTLTAEDLDDAYSSSDAINDKLDAFMNDIKDVTFSNTKLLVPARVEKDTTAGKIKTELGLFPTYPLGLTQSEVLALNAKEYKAGDWALISLKPFDTPETLTIEMKSGDLFTITVTDAQDAQMVGDEVLTITNPAGTTIDLFDYWIVSQDLAGRDGWGDLNQSQGAGEAGDDKPLNGTGNNKGINSSESDPEHGHALKFSPAWAGTVYNGSKVGTTGEAWQSVNMDGKNGLNSYTGDADPFQGIVQGTLVNGYPALTENNEIGSTGESLAYLFDPESANAGKASYPGVDNLLYVDKDGYYTYDSRDYRADYNADGTFTLTEQTSDNSEIRGFWPFGTQNFWTGMHVNTQFSMPDGGQVLNPRGDYKDMQFEFSGDDDTWLYVDGVLVGDGGGIHNRTEIDINFADGTVTVTGENAGGHSGDFTKIKYLDDIFIAAGKYNEDDWEDIGDGSGHKRFKAGTYHTFDMFYLERGGGESNLYIHYNLVSTADFTAHKSYKGYDEDDVMQRNEFRFELIGLDGKYRSVKDPQTGEYTISKEDDDSRAIMPHASKTGAGTVVSPYYNDNTTEVLSNGTSVGSQTYITGNTEDGNVNFGHAEITEQDMHDCDANNTPAYRYIVREIVPDDAVNADGITWADATAEQKAVGGFVKDSVLYDGSVYYMMAAVTSWTETDASGREFTRYGLNKTYYTDDTYTTKKPDTSFIDFRNRYSVDEADFEFDKADANEEPVEGAVFQLFRDSACKIPAKDSGNDTVTATSEADGKVQFNNVRTGIYFMKEVSAPDGYDLNPTVYRVTISRQGSHMSVNADQNNNPVTEVYNLKPGDLTVNKKWVDRNGKEVSGEGHPATVQLRRYRYFSTAPAPETHNVTLHFHFPDSGWNQPNKDFGPYEVTGNSAVIHWSVGGCQFFWDSGYTQQITDGSGDNLLQLPLDKDIELDIYGNQDWASGNLNSVSVSGAFDDSKELRLDEEFPSAAEREKATQILTAGSHMHAWSIGLGDDFDFPPGDENGNYLYYIVELDQDGNEVAINGETGNGMTLQSIMYEPEKTEGRGITHGLITVTNRVDTPSTGSLNIQKTGKVNGEDPVASNRAKIDGDYTFVISGKTGTDTEGNSVKVRITLTDGAATAAEKTGTSVPENVNVSIDNGLVTVSDLPVGDYTVSEELTSAQNEAGIILADSSNTEVTVSAEEDAEIPTSSFINNYQTIDLEVIKSWTDGQTEITEIGYSVNRVPQVMDEEGNVQARFDPEEIPDLSEHGYTGKLSASSDWKETITGLPVNGVHASGDGESVEVTYKYYVSEDPVDGYKTSTRGSFDEDGNYTITITNTPGSSFDVPTDVKVEKKWEEAESTDEATGHDDDTITFRITQKKYPATVSTGNQIRQMWPVRVNLINEDNTPSDLSATVYVKDGDPFVVEADSHSISGIVGGNGFDRQYNYEQYGGSGTFRINEVTSPREVTLKLRTILGYNNNVWGTSYDNGYFKTWICTYSDNVYTYDQLINNITPTGDPVSTVQLDYSMALNSDRNDSVLTKLESGQGTTAGTGVWSGTVSGLPFLALEDGVYYIYTYEVTEVRIGSESVDTADPPDNYNGQTSLYLVKWDKDSSTGIWTITNKEKPITSASAAKEWQNVNGQSIATPEGATVKFELYADGVSTGKKVVLNGKTDVREFDPDEEVAATQELLSGTSNTADALESPAWTAQWSNLPKYQDDGTTEIVYTIKESSVPESFAVVYGDGKDAAVNGGTIINKELRFDLSVYKADKESGEPLKDAEFTIRKLKGSNASQMETDTSFSSITVTTGADGIAEFTSLPIGVFEIEETRSPAGYVLSDFDGKAYIRVTATGMQLLKGERGKAPDSWTSLPDTEVSFDYLSLTGTTLTIGNTPGAALPNAGGIGTTIFYVLGSVLAIGCSVVLISRRRLRGSGKDMQQN